MGRRDRALGEAWDAPQTRLEQEGRREPQLPGGREATGGQGQKGSSGAFRKHEARGLSEELEQSAKKERRPKQFSIPKKTKSCPRKEINHSTLCALSENSVYIVLMLN